MKQSLFLKMWYEGIPRYGTRTNEKAGYSVLDIIVESSLSGCLIMLEKNMTTKMLYKITTWIFILVFFVFSILSISFVPPEGKTITNMIQIKREVLKFVKIHNKLPDNLYFLYNKNVKRVKGVSRYLKKSKTLRKKSKQLQ